MPTIHNNTPSFSVEQIEALPLVGIHRCNWREREIKLYFDPTDDAFLLSVGRSYDGHDIVTSRDRLAGCLNFKVAIDYWKHGNKVYTSD
ncbi:MAG: hypothetical protein NVS1B6_00120 [Steroidobacteraceae bacterium]